MKYIFTLSGNSERFIKEGFIAKPLIVVNEKLVIEYVMEMFTGIDIKDVLFIVNEHDVNHYNINNILMQLYPEATIVIIPVHTKGPIISILKAEDKINDTDQYIVSYCDLTHKWNYQSFIDKIIQSNCDGCLVTHTGMHPHRMRNINFAHLKLKDSTVLEVKEKGYYTDNPINEYASSGIYYFKTGNILKTYCKKMIENNESINGEFYVTLIYNQMIRDGLNVIHYSTDNYVCLGTPLDLIAFKYWKSLMNNKTTDNEINFLRDYWKKYNDIN